MAKKQQAKPKKYKAIADARIGSKPDGSPRLHFIKGMSIELSIKEAKAYKHLIK